ncbi:MAG: NADH:ubiquinone oxidoreductase subunit NDUFA12 [Rhodospirillales bacterium]|nr:NADH:ubiquinone oxidoreductase subunit NDUFA12 [Rhodospirillales bacterium]
MSIGTKLYTKRHGKLVGTDQLGNQYYVEKNPPADRKAKRWVMYNGEPEATKVPAEWHGWLHHTFDEPLTPPQRPTAKEHQPNMTGTAQAYLPPGHELRGGQRERSSGDYEAWQPCSCRCRACPASARSSGRTGQAPGRSPRGGARPNRAGSERMTSSAAGTKWRSARWCW